MKTKDVKERFEGAANQREVFDIIEETIIDELEKAIKPQDFYSIYEKKLDNYIKNVIIIISPRFEGGRFKDKVCIGYDVRIEKEKNNEV